MLTKPTVSNHVRMRAICPTTPKKQDVRSFFPLKIVYTDTKFFTLDKV